jgi:hypothetical protein
MNPINIDHRTESGLIDLNQRVVQRLRLIGQMRAHKAMLEFRIGDRVTFEPEGGAPVYGILTRFLRLVGSERGTAKSNSVIPFKPR